MPCHLDGSPESGDGPGLPHGKSVLYGQIPGFSLNAAQPRDAMHRLSGHRTLGVLDQLIEFSACMGMESGLDPTLKLSLPV